MDAIIQKTGEFIYMFNLKVRWFFYSQVFRNHTSIIFFILCFILLSTFICFQGIGHTFLGSVIYSFVVTVFIFLLLLLIGSYSKARQLAQNELLSHFRFIRNNLNTISISKLGFSKDDRENLNLLLNNFQPKSRIDFRLVSDNRSAADYKKLFRILHLLIEGGIRDFKKERKEMFFKFIESNFTLNGSEVKRASLNSRFSEFVNESETEFSENLKPFQKILNR